MIIGRASSRTVRLRRLVQLASLIAFFAVLFAARPAPGQSPPSWLAVFFQLDPLVLLITLVAARTVTIGLTLAVVTVGITAILGRAFCGWFCPLGTLNAIVSRLGERWLRPGIEGWSRWQLAKYYVLGALLVMSVFGASWLVLLDPFAILYRTTTTVLWPAAQGAIEDGATAVYQVDPHIGGWHVTSLTEPAYQFLRDHLFVKPEQSFLGGGWVLGFLLAILAMNFVRRRFWCRYVCPLGGLLGLLSWRPWLRRTVAEHSCNQCGVCGLLCHGAATDAHGTAWKPQECFGCLNCTSSCPTSGVRFRLSPPWRKRIAAEGTIDLGRREVLASAAAGVVALAVLRSSPQARGQAFHPDLIRPPGARPEPDFLSRCIACGMCMKVCPTGGLQPTWTEAGLAGLWTPQLVARIGYCDYECNRCGEVCPTAAIERLPLERKKTTRIGLAVFDPSRCIPYAFGRDCMVCEEHCPTPEKAIWFEPREVTLRSGERVTLQQPHVDPERCTGCGICENVCPFHDRPGVRISSANESRHLSNQPFLPSGAA